MDNTGTRQSAIYKGAYYISTLFSPVVVPTYSMAVAMWITPLNVLPERTRLLSTLTVMAITAILPMGVIMTLMRLGRVSDSCISDRNERLIPFIAAIVCYLAAALYLRVLHAPGWLVAFFMGAAASCSLATIVNFKWKISGHSIGMGGMVGMMAWLSVHGICDIFMLPWLSVVILISGLVATSRLILDRHTIGQVYAGWLLGTVVVYLFMEL